MIFSLPHSRSLVILLSMLCHHLYSSEQIKISESFPYEDEEASKAFPPDSHKLYKGFHSFGVYSQINLDQIHQWLAEAEDFLTHHSIKMRTEKASKMEQAGRHKEEKVGKKEKEGKEQENEKNRAENNNIVLAAISFFLDRKGVEQWVSFQVSELAEYNDLLLDLQGNDSFCFRVFQSTRDLRFVSSPTEKKYARCSFDTTVLELADLREHVEKTVFEGNNPSKGLFEVVQNDYRSCEKELRDRWQEYFAESNRFKEGLEKAQQEVADLLSLKGVDIKDLAEYRKKTTEDHEKWGLSRRVHKLVDLNSLEKAEGQITKTTDSLLTHFWHSEQRLINFLLKDGFLNKVSQYLRLGNEQPKIRKVIIHVHSLRNFCPICFFSLLKVCGPGGHLREKVKKALNVRDESARFLIISGSFQVFHKTKLKQLQELPNSSVVETPYWSPYSVESFDMKFNDNCPRDFIIKRVVVRHNESKEVHGILSDLSRSSDYESKLEEESARTVATPEELQKVRNEPQFVLDEASDVKLSQDQVKRLPEIEEKEVKEQKAYNPGNSNPSQFSGRGWREILEIEWKELVEKAKANTNNSSSAPSNSEDISVLF